jgi:hypothetical protein
MVARILGIVDGAFALVEATGRVVAGAIGHDVTAATLADLVERLNPTVIVIQKPGGADERVIEGIAAGMRIPLLRVTPSAWRAKMRVVDGDVRERASRLMPAYAYRFSRIRDEPKATASLLALYGLLHRPQHGRPRKTAAPPLPTFTSGAL